MRYAPYTRVEPLPDSEITDWLSTLARVDTTTKDTLGRWKLYPCRSDFERLIVCKSLINEAQQDELEPQDRESIFRAIDLLQARMERHLR